MAASYPSEIFEPRERENKSGVVYDADKKSVVFAEDIDNGDDEIVAIETELGVNAKGIFPTVASRIAAIETRFIDCGIASISDHFRSDVIPDGYAWLNSAPFSIPSTINYKYLNDYLRVYGAVASRGFLYKTMDPRGKFQYVKIIADNSVEGGIRIDDGSDNNYYEFKIYHSGSANFYARFSIRTGGGAVSNTNYAIYPIGGTFLLMLLPIGAGNHTPSYYLGGEASNLINLGSGALCTWTPTRIGITVYGNGALLVDFFKFI